MPLSLGSPSASLVSDEDLRLAVRKWLRQTLPAQWVQAVEAGDRETISSLRRQFDARRWARELGDAGLATPTWPAEYGGLGLSKKQAVIVFEELDALAAPPTPNPIGADTAGPVLLEFGTPSQKQRYLKRMAAQEDFWCQLLSEPGAGSDLAGLGLRAVRKDGGWILNGQKVWSSLAHLCQYGLCFARSNVDVPKHDGITAFVVDMSAPGIEVRPLRPMTGDSDFNEVFFTDTYLPDEQRVGQVDGGWKVARYVLAGGRGIARGKTGMKGGVPARSIESVLNHYAQVDDAEQRLRLTELWIEQRIAELIYVRNAERQTAGVASPSEGSIAKVFSTESVKRVHSLLMNLDGINSMVHSAEDEWAVKSAWMFFRVQGKTISGGANEIQRNIIAERVLGLPREKPADEGMAWKDIPRSARSGD
jgi:alkylation response protein AidB-like acyl-CoA dehydrogenase